LVRKLEGKRPVGDLVDWWIVKYENELYRNRVRRCGLDSMDDLHSMDGLDSMDSGKKEPCADCYGHVNQKGGEVLMGMSSNTMDVS
jgi:hypothetical protein